MPKVLGLTPGKNVPSSRFRINQFHSELAKHNYHLKECFSPIPVDYKFPGAFGRIKQRYIFPLSAGLLLAKIAFRIPQVIRSHNYDITWLNRPLINNIALEKLLHKPLVFDVDDAIWLNDKKHTIKIAEHSDVVFAGNTYIAEWFTKYNKNVKHIPTAIDTNKFKPSARKSSTSFNIVWTGSSQTELYILSIEKSLYKLISNNPEIKLMIISNSLPRFKFLRPDQIVFIKWSSETETSALQNADVGIMPLFNTEWEKGKCSFKMLQYMATGLPVVVSPVGTNKDILSKGEIGLSASTENEWIDALEHLYKNKEKAKMLGVEGRKIVLDDYSIIKVKKSIVNSFDSLI
jgi:glycosyltransferase involved in cell wall biosynthesis